MPRQKSKLKIQTKGKEYNLFDSPLYKLRTKRKLSSILGTSLPELITLKTDEENYSEFEEFGKNGEWRKIQKTANEAHNASEDVKQMASQIGEITSRFKV